MISLLFAIVCSTGFAVVMRLSGNKLRNPYVMTATNYAVCVLCGLFFVKLGDFREARLSYSLLLAVIGGVLFLISLQMNRVNTRLNGIILSSLFNRLGVIVPTFGSILFFGEKPGVFRIIGIVLIFVSVVLMNLGKNEDMGGSRRSGKNRLLLLLLLLCSGLSSMMGNIHDRTANPALKNVYLLTLFFVAMLLSIVCAIREGKKPGKMDFIYGILLGIPNYFSSFFLLNALRQLEATVVYPVYCVGSVALLTVIGIFAFREKLRKNEVIGLGVIALALVFINLK